MLSSLTAGRRASHNGEPHRVDKHQTQPGTVTGHSYTHPHRHRPYAIGGFSYHKE